MAEPLDGDLLADYARTRDASALETLVRRRWSSACRLAYGVLGDPAAAEDAAQQAFVDLVRTAGRYDPARPFGPWFREVVGNAARMQARALGRRRRREERAATRRPDIAPGPAAPDERALAREVEDHVRALPEDVRLAVVLHYYDGLSHAEVAEALGCPKGTAASRIRRGLERLEASLAGAGYGALLPPLALEGWLREHAAPAPAAPSAAAIEALAARAARRTLTLKAAAVAGLVLASAGALVALPDLRRPGAPPAPTLAARSVEPTAAPSSAAATAPSVPQSSLPDIDRGPRGADSTARIAAPPAPVPAAADPGRPASPADPAVAPVPGAAWLEVLCTDDRGAPLPDVEVHALERLEGDVWGPAGGDARSDRGGRARIEVPGDTRYGFSVRVAPTDERDFQMWMFPDPVPLAAGERRAVTLAVPRKARIEGVLVGGVPGETVSFDYRAPFEQANGVASLDEGGHFSLDVNPGRVELVLRQHGRTTARRVLDLAAAQVLHETFALDEGAARVLGRVLDARDRRPIDGATVRASAGEVAAAAKTGADGFFELGDRQAPEAIVVKAKGFLEKTVDLGAGSGAPVEVALDPAGTILVAVVGEGDRPEADVVVFLRPAGRDGTIHVRSTASALTSKVEGLPPGMCRYEDFPPGPYTLRVLLGPGQWRDVDVALPAGETVELRIDLADAAGRGR